MITIVISWCHLSVTVIYSTNRLIKLKLSRRRWRRITAHWRRSRSILESSLVHRHTLHRTRALDNTSWNCEETLSSSARRSNKKSIKVSRLVSIKWRGRSLLSCSKTPELRHWLEKWIHQKTISKKALAPSWARKVAFQNLQAVTKKVEEVHGCKIIDT